MAFLKWTHALVIAFLLQFLILVSSSKMSKKDSIWILLNGIFLVFISSISLSILLNSETLGTLLFDHKKIGKAEEIESINFLHIWEVILPLITGGIGINLITDWILREKKESFPKDLMDHEECSFYKKYRFPLPQCRSSLVCENSESLGNMENRKESEEKFASREERGENG